MVLQSRWLDSSHYQWSRLLQEGHNGRWMVGPPLWSGNEGPVVPVEVAWLSTPEEGVEMSWQDQLCLLLLTVCFYWEGVIHHEHTPPGQAINKEYYLNVLRWLRDVIWWKRPYLWATGDWQFYHDNVPTHASYLMQGFFCKTLTHSGDSAPIRPRFGILWLLAFSKPEFTFEREEISDCQ